LSRIKTLALLFVVALSSATVHGEQDQPACSSFAVPVAVATGDERVIRKIGADKFTTKIEGKEIVATPSPDSGARRILILVDASLDVNEDGWKLAIGLASRLVMEARPEDRFGLRTFGGPIVDLGFGTSRELLLQKLKEMAKGRPRPSEEGGTSYDGLSAALPVFDPPEYGDAIFLFAGGADTRSRAGEGAIKEALQRGQTRVFGFSLSRYDLSGPGSVALEQQLRTTEGTVALARLAEASGGLLLAENTRPFNRPFAATDERLDRVFQMAWRLYGQVVETYRWNLPPSPSSKFETWRVTLARDITQKVPGISVRTPDRILRCTASAIK